MDLSFQKLDYADVEKSMIGLVDTDKISEDIARQSPKVYAKLKKLFTEGNEQEFKNVLNKVQRKINGNAQYRKFQEVMTKIALGNLCDAIFYAVDKKDDPKLEAYIPFRKFSKYLISKGFDGN